MKYIISLLATLCLVLSATALAAPPDNRPKAPMTKPAFGAKPVRPRPENSYRPGNGGYHRPPHHKPGHRPPNWNKPGHRPPNWHKPGHKPPAWHRPSKDRWYWRGKWVNRVRAPKYSYPRGYGYRHWYVGVQLPALFFGPQYYYDDVGPLGLEVPPPGYRWVRYGPDLLLVNLRTGIVEEVAYGVFY